MDSLIAWLSSSALHSWIIDNNWITPVLEVMHFVGLCLMFGALLVIDTRMIGWFRDISVKAVHSLLPWVFIGFGINLITGILFVFYDPGRYLINISFQIKILLVMLAGLNALLYYWKIHPEISLWDRYEATPGIGKFIGVASLVIWVGVLVCGRMIPYVGTG